MKERIDLNVYFIGLSDLTNISTATHKNSLTEKEILCNLIL